MMKAARRGLDATEAGKKSELIAVTQLTSISQEALENELPVRSLEFSETEQAYLKNYGLLTSKPFMFIANVAEDFISNYEEDENYYVDFETLKCGKCENSPKIARKM